MKKSKNWIAHIISVVLLAALGVLAIPQSQAGDHQADATAKRIADVYKIAELLEEYKSKTGHLPIYEPTNLSRTFPPMVVVGSPSAEKVLATQPNPFGISARRYESADLVNDLENTLHRKILLPADPEKHPTHAPNAYYVFIYNADTYLVLCFLSEPSPKTATLQEHVNVYGMGSGSSLKEANFLASKGFEPIIINEIDTSKKNEILKNGDAADKILKSQDVVLTSGL
jgi:hypothetical protein